MPVSDGSNALRQVEVEDGMSTSSKEDYQDNASFITPKSEHMRQLHPYPVDETEDYVLVSEERGKGGGGSVARRREGSGKGKGGGPVGRDGVKLEDKGVSSGGGYSRPGGGGRMEGMRGSGTDGTGVPEVRGTVGSAHGVVVDGGVGVRLGTVLGGNVRRGLVELVGGERLHRAHATGLEGGVARAGGVRRGGARGGGGQRHYLLYLTTDINSEELSDQESMEDVIYAYPPLEQGGGGRGGGEGGVVEGEGMSDNNVKEDETCSMLLSLRGVFITLFSLLESSDVVHQSTVNNTSVVVDGELCHVAYHRPTGCTNKLLLLCLPDKKLSVAELTSLLSFIIRSLQLFHSSVDLALSDVRHHSDVTGLLNHTLRQYTMMSYDTDLPLSISLKHTLPATVRTLHLSDKNKMLLNDCLSEFESADFADMSDDYYGLKRSYSIIGSAIFYKGYLLASHLLSEDLLDVATVLKCYGLLHCVAELNTTQQQQQQQRQYVAEQSIVWRQLYRAQHPAVHMHIDNDVTQSRVDDHCHAVVLNTYCLIVNLANAVFVVLVDKEDSDDKVEGRGDCGYSVPDVFVVSQAKSTLDRLAHSLHIFEQCENKLQSLSMPSISCIDTFLKTDKDSLYRSLISPSHRSLSSSSSTTLPSTDTAVKKTKENKSSLSSFRTGKGGRRNLRQLFQQTQSFSIVDDGGLSPSSSSEQEDDENDNDDDGVASVELGGEGGRGRRRDLTHHASNDSLASLSSSSRFASVKRRQHNLPSLYDMMNLKQDLAEPLRPINQSINLKTRSYAADNNVFNYVHIDDINHIYRTSTEHQLKTVSSAASLLHYQVLKQFNDTVALLRPRITQVNMNSTLMNSTTARIIEHGILYRCNVINWHDNKKPPPSTSYWIIGSRQGQAIARNGADEEVYVCLHNSSTAHPNITEMLYRLVQGTTLL